MNRVCRWLALSLVLLGGGCGGPPETILLGHLAPRGDAAQVQALKLSVDLLNRDPAQRPLGKRLLMIHAEGGKSLQEWQAQAVRLAAVNRVALLLGGTLTEEAAALGDAAQGDAILALSGAGGPGAVPNPFLFCLGLSPARQAKSLVAALPEPTHQVLLVSHVQTPEAIPQAIRAEFAARPGNPPPLREELWTGQEESLNRIRQQLTKADVLILALTGEERTRLLEPGKGVQVPAKAMLILAGEESENLEGPAPPNAYTLCSYSPAVFQQRSRPFLGEWQVAAESLPLAAALLHDAFGVGIAAMQQAREWNGRKLREALLAKEWNFETLSGPVKFLPDGTCSRPHWLLQSRDGRWQASRKFD